MRFLLKFWTELLKNKVINSILWGYMLNIRPANVKNFEIIHKKRL